MPDTDNRLLFSAHWTSPTTGLVSLRRDWKRPRPPALFWGEDRKPLQQVRPVPPILYGLQSGYFLDGEQLHFVLRCERHPDLDTEDGVYVVGPFNGWTEAVGDDTWRLQRRTIDGTEAWVCALPRAQVYKGKPLPFKFLTGSGRWIEVPGDAPNVTIDGFGNRNFEIRPNRTGRHQFSFTTPLPMNRGAGRRLHLTDGTTDESVPIQAGVFVKQLHTDRSLGALVRGNETTFRLFAPRASGVRLLLTEDAETLPEKIQPLPLSPLDETTWEVRVPGNRHGWYYWFQVEGEGTDGFSHFDGKHRVLDPYALAVVGPRGPAIVVDAARLPRVERPFAPPSWHDLVIVECHLRDLIAESGLDLSAEERLGFTGLRRYIEDRACYLRELGVNAVELQPIQEFDNVDPTEYAWGYMPVAYFAPASQYASNPRRASQIGEFKAVVDAFHKAGLAVIVDVVYNHVGEPNHLQYIDKQYYFLLDAQGEFENHSGCGNTLDCNTPMVRRLIVDSLTHLLRTYDVDGFRFDLGELLGRDTLAYVERMLKTVKPSVFLVCEPWSFRAHIAHELRATGVASWNDGFREFVREYVWGRSPAEGLAHYLQASLASVARFPAQTVNYVESHDDRCWLDKITENPDHNGGFPTPTDRRRTHLMAAILMTAAGIPMLSAGMDFLKSKQGTHNTYLRGDLNALPYNRRIQFADTHDYFREWIALRLSHAGRLLRLDQRPGPHYWRRTSTRNALALAVNADRSLGPDRLVFAINPHFESVELPWPLAEGPAGFRQIADHARVDLHGLPSARLPLRDGQIRLPGLSCGLWYAPV